MLQRLGLTDELAAIANPLGRVLARTVAGDTLFDVDVPATVPSSLRDPQGHAVCFTVMRADLQRMLAAQLPPGASDFTRVRVLG